MITAGRTGKQMEKILRLGLDYYLDNRLILINPQTGSQDFPGRDDVWAIDLDTGEWTEILAPSAS